MNLATAARADSTRGTRGQTGDRRETGTRGGVLWGTRTALLTLLLAAAGALGCAHQVPLRPSRALSDAEGRLTLIEKKHGIRVVRVDVEDIGELNERTSNPGAYVVWAAADGEPLRSVGVLRVREDRGVLEAVAPRQRFQLFVTAESSAAVPAPAGQPVFFADVR